MSEREREIRLVCSFLSLPYNNLIFKPARVLFLSPSPSPLLSSSPLPLSVIQHFRVDVIAQTEQAFRALSM